MSLKGEAGTVSGMTIIAELPHNLAVVFGHLEEVGNIHAAFITFFTTADRHDSVSNFLLTNDQEVRHLLQFALAVLVAELLTPTASAAAALLCVRKRPRSRAWHAVPQSSVLLV